VLNYIIDGNNLIGKISSLMHLQKKDKQASRDKLTFLLDRFFNNRKANVTLHLDGFAGQKINSSKIKIVYSEKFTADEKIKLQIEKSSTRKSLVVITSDSNLAQFAKVCSCTVISSEVFAAQLNGADSNADEEKIINSMQNNLDEFKKLFDV
jgi:predicted RNA-binding protein with PIN domain